MKYILRAVIVIAIIVGIVFGVRQCSSQMSNEMKVFNSVTSNYTLLNGKELKDRVYTISNHLTVYDSVMSSNQNTLVNSKLNEVTDNYNKIEKYLIEISFAKNVSNEDVSNININLENLINVKKKFDKYIDKINSTQIIEQSGFSVTNSTMSRYIEELRETLDDFVNCQETTLVTYGNYILKYVYNETLETTNYSALKVVIEQISVEG